MVVAIIVVVGALHIQKNTIIGSSIISSNIAPLLLHHRHRRPNVLQQSQLFGNVRGTRNGRTLCQCQYQHQYEQQYEQTTPRGKNHTDAMALGQSPRLSGTARRGIPPFVHPNGMQDDFQPDPFFVDLFEKSGDYRQQRQQSPRQLDEAPRSDLQKRPPERTAVHRPSSRGGSPVGCHEQRGGSTDASTGRDDCVCARSVWEGWDEATYDDEGRIGRQHGGGGGRCQVGGGKEVGGVF
mmetsp:Transcript_34661/g.58857  ORF Transcript_34661/g.58857 Transcript_34661/m.58857 type:complete len:238 (-) Transcript_34661:223-936(-)